jgi:hypothetical protein
MKASRESGRLISFVLIVCIFMATACKKESSQAPVSATPPAQAPGSPATPGSFGSCSCGDTGIVGARRP